MAFAIHALTDFYTRFYGGGQCHIDEYPPCILDSGTSLSVTAAVALATHNPTNRSALKRCHFKLVVEQDYFQGMPSPCSARDSQVDL